MEVYLRPKNILIMGGGSGIGYACAQKLLDAGAKNVIIASRNLKKLEKAKKSLTCSKEQNVFTLCFDISKVSTHNEKIMHVQKLLGKDNPLDGLIVSSGVNFDGSNWKGFNISEADWDRIMDVNLKGAFFLIRNFANFLYSSNIKGNICVVSSISAHRDLLSIYQITKNALSRIVHAYGKHLCERGVVLNCVEPGQIHTDMMAHLKDYTDGVREGKSWDGNSIRRILRAEEIAEIVYFLMSNLGETMSGSCVLAGGGNKSIFP